MKIALITIWHEKNFGAEIQCYALVKALRGLGHEVEVIDYHLSEIESPTIRQKFIEYMVKFTPENKSFKRFWRKYIPSGRHYTNNKELRNKPPQADMYLVGSDQVWNIDITQAKWQTYFLDFVGNGKKLCSYASSFGENSWKWPDKKDTAIFMLSRFSEISVRETAGQNLLTSDLGIASKVVLDPTFLHDDYKEIITPKGTRKTLVYYPLSDFPELEIWAKELALWTDLEFVNTNEKEYIMGRIVWRRTAIEEWIKNIAEASLVVTPSFHGLALSLIYRRQFIIVQNEKMESRNSRITDLLNTLGLRDRFFTSIDQVKMSEIWKCSIDYSRIEPLLESLRKESWNYLKKITNL